MTQTQTKTETMTPTAEAAEVEVAKLQEARLAAIEQETSELPALIMAGSEGVKSRLTAIEARLDELKVSSLARGEALGTATGVIERLTTRVYRAADEIEEVGHKVGQLEKWLMAEEEAREASQVRLHPRSWINIVSSARVMRTESGDFAVRRKADAKRIAATAAVAGAAAYGGYRGVKWLRADGEVIGEMPMIDDGEY